MVLEGAPAWYAPATMVVILTSFVLMAMELAPPDMIMIGALITLLPMGIISTAEATAGFAQPGLLTVMVLFAVTTGLERTGAFEPIRNVIIPKRGARSTAVHELLARYLVPVAAISAFLNNTPVVGLMISTVTDMASKSGLPPSKLLIPLSYAAILGGTCTIIGTSTNLVLVSLAQKAVQETSGERFEFGFFEIGRIGLPVLLMGLLFLFTLSGPLLPARDAAVKKVTPSRVYKLTAVVSDLSRVIGKSIEDTGISSIEGCTLQQIVRGETILSNPQPTELLNAGDMLVFAGQVDGITQLMRAPRKGLRKLLQIEQAGRGQMPRLPGLGSRAEADAEVAPRGSEEEDAPSAHGPPARADLEAHAASAAERPGAAHTAHADAPHASISILVPGQGNLSSRSTRTVPEALRLQWRRWAHAMLSWLRPSPMPKLVEVVLAPRSRVVGLKSRAFNETFESTVVAIARDEVRTSTMVGSVASDYGIDLLDAYMFANKLREESKIGTRIADVALRKDDSLLLLTTGAFLEKFKSDPAFSQINELEKHAPLRHSRAALSIVLALGMIIVTIAAREQTNLLTVSLYTVAAMLLSGCLTPDEARESFRIDIYLVIGAAFGLSQAMVNSGAAAAVARWLVSVGGSSMSGLIVLLYLVTALLTEVITNNAAVALMFPIAFELHLADPDVFALRPLMYALMMAASASFITPTGYTTNLMVYKPGGYRYADYPRIGVPLQLLAMGVSCGVIITLDVWYVWVLLFVGLLVVFFVLARVFPRACCAPSAYRSPDMRESPSTGHSFVADSETTATPTAARE
jgi:di/tricarboxylate transporter